jgi:hypothetical protein
VSISIGIFPYVFVPQTSFLNQKRSFALFSDFLNFMISHLPGVPQISALMTPVMPETSQSEIMDNQSSGFDHSKFIGHSAKCPFFQLKHRPQNAENRIGFYAESLIRRTSLTVRRNQRALSAIRALRHKQTRQNQQIGLLCQDMVSAHGQFAQKLSRMTFVTGFYETLLGSGNLEALLDTAALAIQARLRQANVAVFILEKQGFDIHLVSAAQDKPPLGREHFQQWFTTAAANNVALAGQVCSAERLLTLGMQASPALLKQISIAAVPLGVLGHAVGFVLLWRSADQPLLRDQLETVAAVASGLRAAIQAHRGAADTIPPVQPIAVNSQLSS